MQDGNLQYLTPIVSRCTLRRKRSAPRLHESWKSATETRPQRKKPSVECVAEAATDVTGQFTSYVFG
jgi:hypothetical protein